MAIPSNVIQFRPRLDNKEPEPPTVAGVTSFWPEAMRGRFGHHPLLKLHNEAITSESAAMLQAAFAIMTGYVRWAHPRGGRDRQKLCESWDKTVAENIAIVWPELALAEKRYLASLLREREPRFGKRRSFSNDHQ